MLKLANTKRVTAVIHKSKYKLMQCLNETARDIINNYLDDILYGDKIKNKIDLLEEKKAFYVEQKEKAEIEINKIDQELNDLHEQIKEIENERKQKIKEAEQEVLNILDNIYNAYEKNEFGIKRAKFKDIEHIANKYDVPVYSIIPKEPKKSYYSRTLEDYKKHIPEIYFYK